MLGTITDDSWSSPAELKRLFSLETPNRSEFCDQVHHLQPKKLIRDPEATQPEDWDDEDGGEWEAPLIDNPEYEEKEGLERSMQRLGAYAITYHELTRQNSIEKRKSSTGFGGKNRNLQQKLNGRRVISGKKSNQEEKKLSSNGKCNGKSNRKRNGKSNSGNGSREMNENESKKEEKKSSSHGNVAEIVDVDVDAPEILTKEVHVVEDLVEDVEILNEENVDEIEWIGSEDESESRPQEVIEIWEEEDNIQGTQSNTVVLLDEEDDEALGEGKEEEYKDDDEEEDEDEDDETDIDDYEDFVDAVGRDDQQQMVHERVCDRHWKKFVEIFPNKITCTTCRCHVSQIVLDQYEELMNQAEETENEFGKLHRYNEAILLIDDDPMLHTKMLMLADKLGCT